MEIFSWWVALLRAELCALFWSPTFVNSLVSALTVAAAADNDDGGGGEDDGVAAAISQRKTRSKNL